MSSTKKASRRFANIEGETFDVVDAKKDVVIPRTLADLWLGKPGLANQCMNANCVLHHQEAFPHPVIAVSVLRTRVYVVTSAPEPGKRGTCVRYVLPVDATRRIDAHDTEGVGEPGDLTLLAPVGKQKGGARHAGVNRGTRTGERSGRVIGGRARVLAAVGAGRLDD